MSKARGPGRDESQLFLVGKGGDVGRGVHRNTQGSRAPGRAASSPTCERARGSSQKGAALRATPRGSVGLVLIFQMRKLITTWPVGEKSRS